MKIKNDRVQKVRVLEDELSKYIPYCSFSRHIGVPNDNYKCERRKCEYYSKFRMYEK